MKDYFRWFLIVKMESFFRRASTALVRLVSLCVGTIQYVVYADARRTIRRSLASDLNLEPARRELAVILSFYHHLCNELNLVKYPDIDRQFIKQNIKFSGSGWTYLRRNQKTGILLVTFHFGPNQIIIPALHVLGVPFTQIAVPPTFWDHLVKGSELVKAVNRKRTTYLEATGADFIYVSEGIGTQREMFRAAKRGKALCVAVDGRIGELKTFPFLRGGIDIALGGFNLAQRMRIPIIPVISLRKEGKYFIDMQAPVDVTPQNTDEVVRQCVSHLENYVRRYPEQYGWMYYAKEIGG